MPSAHEVYNNLISMLDAFDWKYERDDEHLLIKSGVRSEDLPIEFFLHVVENNEVVQFISSLPFRMPDDMRVDGAIAVAVANYGMVDGSFDYDISDGEIRFRLTTAYRDTMPSAEILQYIIGVASSTVDKYNDRFFMLAKKMITIEDFIKKENE